MTAAMQVRPAPDPEYQAVLAAAAADQAEREAHAARIMAQAERDSVTLWSTPPESPEDAEFEAQQLLEARTRSLAADQAQAEAWEKMRVTEAAAQATGRPARTDAQREAEWAQQDAEYEASMQAFK
jgi:hypothetical protein